MSFVWMNGQVAEESTATVSIKDAGLLHGAGVFTTMRAYGGKVFGIRRHLARVRDSCQLLRIPLTFSDDALAAAAEQVLAANQLQHARMRLTATRGAARHDPVHGVALTPTVLVTAVELEEYPAALYQHGMTVVLIDEQKLNPYDRQAGHKTLNYLSRLLALRQANEQKANEALWFNVHNYLQCGCISNVFLVKNGELFTPPTTFDLRDEAVSQGYPYPRSNVLPGIARAVVLEAARGAGLPVRLVPIDVNRLLDADEVFLTNSMMQVMPVCRVEQRAIGQDRPGTFTAQLASAYDRQVAVELS